jgi:hypothetical protein
MDKPEAIRIPLITDFSATLRSTSTILRTNFYKPGTTCSLTYEQPRCRTCGLHEGLAKIHFFPIAVILLPAYRDVLLDPLLNRRVYVET